MAELCKGSCALQSPGDFLERGVLIQQIRPRPRAPAFPLGLADVTGLSGTALDYTAGGNPSLQHILLEA